MMQLPARPRRLLPPRPRSHEVVACSGIALLLALSACGEAQPAASTPSAPSETVRAPVASGALVPVASGSTMDSAQSSAPASTAPEAMPSERVSEQIELAPSEPAKPTANEPVPPAPSEPATPVASEPAPVTMTPGQPVPAIAQPGFPVGSAPRLVPLEFIGPITGLPVLFNIYLPPGYDSGTASYPVLYDLHGRGNNRDTNPGPVIGSLETAMRNRVIGPLIVVFPQSFPEGYWSDSQDHTQPGETEILRELLPHVASNFRTVEHRARRAVSGFSMGGFGAMAYAVKYPELFSVGIAYDGALDTWETLIGRRPEIGTVTYGDDESYFDQIAPWANATRNAAALIASSQLRAISGARYNEYNAAFRDHLATLGVPFDLVQTNCDHVYGCPLGLEGQASWAILQATFSRPATAP